MIHDTEAIVRVLRNEALARDWELALLAQGLSPRSHHTSDGIVLTVPRHELDKALAGLAAYEEESLPKAQPPDVAPAAADLRAGVVAAVVLIGFFGLTVAYAAVPWLERGSANAARILEGEVWRAVTALTLHADVAHALSNAFAIAVFFSAVSGQLGVGIGGGLVLLAGAGGNLANAYFQGSPHDALGASTAIFAAVGMLGSLAMVRRRRARENRRRAWITIAASLALLGMLGSSGTRVDILGHLSGFLAGSALGIPAGLVLPRAPHALQWAGGAAVVMLIVGCWIAALH